MEKIKHKNSKHPYTHLPVVTHSNLFPSICPFTFSPPSERPEANHRHYLIISVNISTCISKR